MSIIYYIISLYPIFYFFFNVGNYVFYFLATVSKLVLVESLDFLFANQEQNLVVLLSLFHSVSLSLSLLSLFLINK